MHEPNIVSLPGTEQKSIGVEKATTNGCQECWCPVEECPSSKDKNTGMQVLCIRSYVRCSYLRLERRKTLAVQKTPSLGS